MRRTVVTDSEAKAFSQSYNTLRQDCQSFGSLTIKDWCGIFKKYGLLHTQAAVSAACSYGLLVRVSYGAYELPKEPIYYKVCGEYMNKMRAKAREKYRRHREKTAEAKPIGVSPDPVKVIPVVEKPKVLQVEECVAFLKEKGYIILKIC